MEGMTTGGKLLAQDDIDALLNEAGVEGDYSSDSEAKKETAKEAALSIPKPKKVSNKDAKSILEKMCGKALLQREEGIKVIWNASKAFPMAPGVNLKIEGAEYTSLGVLFEKHLIVGARE